MCRKVNKKFLIDQQGSIIIPFALFLPIFMLVMALSIDATQTYVVRSKVIAAQDAAALAAAVVPKPVLDDRGMTRVEYADQYVNLNLGSGKYFNADIDINFRETDDQLFADSSTTMSQNYFAEAAGTHTTELTAGRETVIDFKHSKSIKVLTAVVSDGSGSMRGGPMSGLKAAINEFLDITYPEDLEDPVSEVSLVLYGTSLRREFDFTNEKQDLKDEVAIYDAPSGQYTCGSCGVDKAHELLTAKIDSEPGKYDDYKKQVIFLTDGVMNRGRSLNVACREVKDKGYEVIGITFGRGARRGPVLACASPDEYYHAPNSAELKEIFKDIAETNVKSRVTY